MDRTAGIREDRRETFRKWATLTVATLGLVVACLRDPLSWTLRATIEGVLHQELAKFDLISTDAVAGRTYPTDIVPLLRRLDREIVAIRSENASRDEGNCRILLERADCLSAIQTNLTQIMRQNEVLLSSGVNRQSTNRQVSRDP